MAKNGTQHYDILILGAGQAAMPLMGVLATAPQRTAIIERSALGGTCLNRGCTPTKTMVASAKAAYVASRGAEFGISIDGKIPEKVMGNMQKVVERKRQVVGSFQSFWQHQAEAAQSIDIVYGEARFVGPKEVEVALREGGSKRFTATSIIINAGCRPTPLTIPGGQMEGILDSTSVLELEEMPRHLVVIGGGYVGLEFAQLFSRLGATVTVIQRDGQLLSREDPDIAQTMADIFEQDGVRVLLRTNATKIIRNADGSLTISVATPSGTEELSASHVLVAAGRIPNSDTLNLTAAGIKADTGGYISTNERLETSAEGIYALGDIKGGPAFTHIANDDHRIVAANIIPGGAGGRSTQDRIVSYTVYTDPQLGRVGLSEAEARAAGYKVRVARIPMTLVVRAVEAGESRGMMKAVVDTESGKVLGAAVLGLEGGEIMAMLHVAMLGGLRFEKLRDAAFSHPSLSEGLNVLFNNNWVQESG